MEREGIGMQYVSTVLESYIDSTNADDFHDQVIRPRESFISREECDPCERPLKRVRGVEGVENLPPS